MGERGLAIASEPHAAGDLLTKGQIEVLRLAAAGARNSEMARALEVSPKAVEARLTRLYRKLHVRSRVEAVIAAQEAGILDLAARQRNCPDESLLEEGGEAPGSRRTPGSGSPPKNDCSLGRNGNGNAVGCSNEWGLNSVRHAMRNGSSGFGSETRELNGKSTVIKADRASHILRKTLVNALSILEQAASDGQGMSREDSARLSIMRAATEQCRLALNLLDHASSQS